jgi:colanic acid biosynthesis glycosyl transferase WcaI
MRILIVTLHYIPDGGPSAPLFAMLAEALVAQGHEVVVVAAAPHYPSGRTLSGWSMPLDGVEGIHGVTVHRIGVPSGARSRLWFRALQFAVFQIGAAWRLWQIGTFDAAVFSNPALQAWLPWLAARFTVRGPRVFSIHDVYPDVGRRLGVFTPGRSDAIVEWLEANCVRTADHVRILAPAFAEPARRLGASDDHLSLIYDWVDTAFIRPVAKENAFRREFGLSGKFVFLYAGNIGLSQGLESVVRAAATLRHRDDVRFVFVGGGAGLDALRKSVAEADVHNVVFAPFQPRARLPEVLGAADVSLIMLRAGLTDSLPSKVYSILASGRPVLASVDAANDVCEIIQRADAGVLVAPDDDAAFAGACESFIGMPRDRVDAMGSSGRAYVDAHHSPAAAAAQFVTIFTGRGHPPHG